MKTQKAGSTTAEDKWKSSQEFLNLILDVHSSSEIVTTPCRQTLKEKIKKKKKKNECFRLHKEIKLL